MKLLNQLLLAILGMVFLTGCKESTSILSLAGEWEFAIDSMDIGYFKTLVYLFSRQNKIARNDG